MFVKPHDVPPLLCFNVQTEMGFRFKQLLFPEIRRCKKELFKAKSHFSLQFPIAKRTCVIIDSQKHNKANLRDLIAATGLVISNWIKIINFSARVTVKFDGWPRKTIGHIFFTILSFVHHFKAMSEFNLELQYGNAQFGSKSAIFCPVRPWNLTDDIEKH